MFGTWDTDTLFGVHEAWLYNEHYERLQHGNIYNSGIRARYQVGLCSQHVITAQANSNSNLQALFGFLLGPFEKPELRRSHFEGYKDITFDPGTVFEFNLKV